MKPVSSAGWPNPPAVGGGNLAVSLRHKGNRGHHDGREDPELEGHTPKATLAALPHLVTLPLPLGRVRAALGTPCSVATVGAACSERNG